ncbi:hypothetical protein MUY14_32465 [Amycolatopsis sp. FBCC-B4732]|uniref:hypothetical protein n=1 Tax=Amycolatopsis sp. FBCC-B4732 TaxID=3079339 RepID=UPI001FF6B36B|nr:hypothetical protein [Amycolatopsis sp. FBCC-B4732]UOX86440.1 hypothetical protein MUY14_32465 [Amycolatopsis sp. FBCC-B4732]
MKTSPRWRQAVVWLHVVSSVAWMSQALALVVLMSAGAPAMADRLDSVLLAPMANVSAFTGLLLAGATAWGYFRHWWVLTKFVLTLVQLYAGIFLLSPALRDSADTGTVVRPQVAGASLMASALAFQAWLSIAKPGRKTPWSPPAKPPTAPAWVFVAGVGAPAFDVTAGLLLGYPLPALSLVTLIVLGFERRRRRRRARRPTARSPRSAPGSSSPAT